MNPWKVVQNPEIVGPHKPWVLRHMDTGRYAAHFNDGSGVGGWSWVPLGFKTTSEAVEAQAEIDNPLNWNEEIEPLPNPGRGNRNSLMEARKMKMFTKEIERKLRKAGPDGDTAICKIFNPGGAGTWVIFGQETFDPDILVCVADLGMDCIEFGSVRRSELEEYRGKRFGLPLERDLHFSNAGEDVCFFLDLPSLVGC